VQITCCLKHIIFFLLHAVMGNRIVVLTLQFVEFKVINKYIYIYNFYKLTTLLSDQSKTVSFFSGKDKKE
jgi:hypothetical protein